MASRSCPRGTPRRCATANAGRLQDIAPSRFLGRAYCGRGRRTPKLSRPPRAFEENLKPDAVWAAGGRPERPGVGHLALAIAMRCDPAAVRHPGYSRRRDGDDGHGPDASAPQACSRWRAETPATCYPVRHSEAVRGVGGVGAGRGNCEGDDLQKGGAVFLRRSGACRGGTVRPGVRLDRAKIRT